jgi:hypothetical protein
VIIVLKVIIPNKKTLWQEGTMPVDEAKLNELVGKMVGDMGAAMSTALIVLGDRVGLYKAMDGAGPLTSEEVAGARAARSAMSESGSLRRQPLATSRMTARRIATS